MFEKMGIFVHKETGDRFVIYRDDFKEVLDDYSLSPEQTELLPLTEATAQEFATHLANELENANFHSLVEIPETLLKNIQEKGLPEEQQLIVLWALADALKDNFY